MNVNILKSLEHEINLNKFEVHDFYLSRNSFFLFCDQEKKKVQDQMPNAKSQEVRKELAIRWKKAPDNVKIQFKNRAKDLQREYSKKLKKFHEKNKNNKKGLGTFKPTTEKNSDSEDEDTDSD